MKNIKYTFEESILIRKFTGNVTIDVLISSLKYMLINNFFTKNITGIISDFSGANFLIAEKELAVLKKLYLENYEALSNVKFAQIITTPKIAQTMLFEKKNSDISTRSFSTLKAAKAWINQA